MAFYMKLWPYTDVDGIDKDNVVCNKNIEIGERLRVRFLIDTYI